MNFLEERIVKDGIIKEGNVLKVDSFLNHQMDIDLFNENLREDLKVRILIKFLRSRRQALELPVL